MYLTIQIQPQLGATLSVNRKCGLQGGPIQSTIQMIITATQATIVWFEVGQGGSPVTQVISDWIVTSDQLNIQWTQTYDSQTSAMQIPVLYVSAQVQQYSQGYMSTDPHKPRFFSYLSLFTFFMQIQITADNLQVQFVGWEGVGQASYQLINFWFTRIAANMAAQKAFIQNRIGDWGQTIGIILTICVIGGDVSFDSLQSQGQYINTDIIFILSILFLIGAAAKSAQFSGLHSWLASAMEGPTPVSALIHAATMVTAGVYQQIRQSPQQEWCSNSLLQITWLGGMSALQGAACGLQENDIKRVIAFSTTSQQGYMVIACGQSQYNLGLFHLINHAFFKAQLFLSAGAVIHAVADQQDMRKLGGLIFFIPFSYAGIFIGSQSLMAFPFMTGFYSKDLLLELAQVPHNYTRSIAYIFAISAAFLSAIYSVRQQILTFLSKPHFPYSLIQNKMIVDPSITMLLPQILLAIGSVFFGYLTHETFLGLGSSIYQGAIFIHPNNIALLDGSMIPTSVKISELVSYDASQFQNITLIQGLITSVSILKYLPLVTLFILIMIQPLSRNINNDLGHSSTQNMNVKAQGDINLLKYPISSNNTFRSICYSALTLNHFNIFNHWIIFQVLTLSNTILRYWDRGLVEIIGPLGLVRVIHHFAFQMELYTASGRLIHYAFIIVSSSLLFFVMTLIITTNCIRVYFLFGLILIFIILLN